MLRVCLDDHEALLLLKPAAEDFARTSVPREHLQLFHHGHNDGIAEARGKHPWHCNQHVIPQIGRKDDGQTVHDRRGTSLRAIPVRVVHTGGTDCVGHAVRVVTDHDPEMTVLSIDGIRSLRSRVSKLHSVEVARSPQSPFHVAVRQEDLRTGFHVSVVRRGRCEPQDRATRGWGTR